jgi:hypothetical protein
MIKHLRNNTFECETKTITFSLLNKVYEMTYVNIISCYRSFQQLPLLLPIKRNLFLLNEVTIVFYLPRAPVYNPPHSLYSTSILRAHVVFSSCEVRRAKRIDSFCYDAELQSTQQQMFAHKNKAWRLFLRLQLGLSLMYCRGWGQHIHIYTSCLQNSFNYQQ